MIQDRARRLGGSGQLTELAGQRSNASSQGGPATGHGVTAQLRQPNCTPGLGSARALNDDAPFWGA